MAVWAIHKGLDCQKCNEQMKQVRGCQGLQQPVEIEEIGITVDRCPARMLDEENMMFIEMFHHYKNGFLPYEGGWFHQPTKITQAIKIIGNTMVKMEEKK